MAGFKEKTGNQNFRRSFFTWLNLILLVIFYPVISVYGTGQDPAALLKNLTQTFLIILLVSTIVFQWAIFGVNYLGVYFEGTGLRGVGFKRIRGLDFAWAAAFLLAANLILSGLAWFLGQIGLPMPGEIGLLIPTTGGGKVLWVAVALTAGICEEVAFRGYLLTRLRLVGRLQSWVIPVIVSSLVFGICHAYQGIPGLIVISTYGLMFALLYIRTGSIWPCIIAHFFQDFSALFIPH